MSLPKPVLSNDDIVGIQDTEYQSSREIWNTWSKDPIKAAVLRAIVSCGISLYTYFGQDISLALTQNTVCFLHSFSLGVEEVHYSSCWY